MRVVIDDQISTSQWRGGISRYFAELIEQFRANDEHGIRVFPPRFTRNRHYLNLDIGRSLPSPLDRSALVLRAANRIAPIRVADADVVHHTHYSRHYLSRFQSATYRVVTVYDMIPELLPEFFPGGNPHLDKEEFVRSADIILCISESTKRDLVEVYGPPAAPLIVTPLGVHSQFSPDVPPLPQMPSKYVLHVGDRGGYKDFRVLARAFASCAATERGTQLVVVGGRPFDENELQELFELGIDRKIRRLELDDAELVSAYAHARCFVFPSRYEGFGLPTLEAMATGCPTILARSSSHPEVGGDAAAYFEPEDVDDLIRVLDEVLTDQARRAEMRSAGFEHAASFTWTRTAAMTAHAYGLLNGRN